MMPCTGQIEWGEDDVRALITGITGFAGSFLAEHLLAQGNIEVVGVGLPQGGPGHVSHLLDRLQVSTGMLDDAAWTRHILAETQPDYIFHLAAQASPALAIADPAATLVPNIVGQVNILEGCLACHLDPVILIVGSGDEYGLVAPADLPITETTPLRPTNPYAVSKIAQDMLGLQYFLSHQLRCVRVRPFNHIGPRQGDAFVVASFARQIAEAEAGLHPPVVHVGNLETARDFTDVRDMMRAYWLAVRLGTPGEVYNIGSGNAYSIQGILRKLIAMSSIPLQVAVDPAKLRPTDVAEVRCDCTRFTRATGWRTTIPIEQTLRDVLTYWRERVKGKR
jgi:GDP-4-dehydro-6-deoxy-D-mannose reductase